MRLQNELTMALLCFMAMNLLLALASIGLFVRMGPAVERILQRNDETIIAAEEILAVLASSTSGGVEDRRDRALSALGRIRENVTEADEPAAIQVIEENLGPALAGETASRESLIEALGRLIRINRSAMLDADLEAQRLGRSGAWAAAIVAGASLVLGLMLGARLSRRVVRPLLELRSVLRAVQAGDRYRRSTSQRAAVEIQDTLRDLDSLLDARDVVLAKQYDDDPMPDQERMATPSDPSGS